MKQCRVLESCRPLYCKGKAWLNCIGKLGCRLCFASDKLLHLSSCRKAIHKSLAHFYTHTHTHTHLFFNQSFKMSPKQTVAAISTHWFKHDIAAATDDIRLLLPSVTPLVLLLSVVEKPWSFCSKRFQYSSARDNMQQTTWNHIQPMLCTS